MEKDKSIKKVWAFLDREHYDQNLLLIDDEE